MERKPIIAYLKERTCTFGYGIKGTADKKFSTPLEKLQKQGYPFKYKIFTQLGHGGLAGERPEQFLEEMAKAHEGAILDSEK